MSRKIFTACLGTETNSFSPIPTGMALFEQTMLVRGARHGERPNLFALPLIAWRRRAEALGWQVVESLAAFAMPAGDTTRHAYQTLRDEILSDLRNALPVDAVLLNLHGAMIAEGYPDAEGDLLARARDIVGPAVPIGVELDLHCHLTELKVRSATAIVIYKEYPHVDVVERAEELFTIVEGTLAGRIWPVMAMHDCRMLGIYPTTREPLESFVARMKALEGKDDILSVSLAHGFPWGDTPEVGTRVLVVAHGDGQKADALAKELGREVWARRDEMMPPFKSIDEALARAAGHNGYRPLVLADTADNPGIGAAGDSTFLLRQVIDQKIGGVAISPLWDPSVTALAFDAGLGAKLRVRIGGKLGPASGTPIDAEVTVKGLTGNAFQPFGGALAPLGNMAWLRIGENDTDAIDIAVNDHRVQSFHPDCFSAVGIDPARCRALIVKSTQHFFAGFAPIAEEILYVAAPGTGAMDMRTLPHRHVTRALWPRVADPHA
ncbi:MAG: M81 family metallopeptidase [Alphaproteobacteria bacterium]|nr:M81 family metallopeptidase [Alphaproteobacteria bacterium]